MVDIKELEKRMNNANNQEKFKEWATQYAKHIDESNLRISEIIANEEYINWLLNFTSEYEIFSDDSWLYCPEEISQYDYEKVSHLCNFFEAVESYANMNYLAANETQFGHTYSIAYKDVFLEVGVAVGQGTTFYISRKNEATSAIAFSDIQAGKKTTRAKQIDTLFTRLEGVVDELSQAQVSSNMVLVKTKEILNKKSNS